MVNVSRLRLKKKGVGIFLSPLEEDILNVLWTKDDARVRDIYGQLRKRKKIALTSVAVSLDRLHSKKAVGRKVEVGRGGPHYIYYSKNSKQDFERSLIDSAVNKLIDSFGGIALSYFNDRFNGREDPARSEERRGKK